MKIQLSAAAEALIADLLASGEFAGAADVVEQAIRLLRAWDDLQAARLRAAVQLGVEDFEKGDFAPWKEVTDQLRASITGQTSTLSA